MRVSFFSNYFNHHQLPLAIQLYRNSNVDFTFVSLKEGLEVAGRRSLDHAYDFVVREYDGPDSSLLALDHALYDDVVIFGDMAGKEQYVKRRNDTGKLFFRYTERALKRGDSIRYFPPKAVRVWNQFLRYRNSNMYVLCAGAYVARDLSLFGFPRSKCLSWGYFPEVHARDCVNPLSVGETPTILSAQRLVRWKNVSHQIDMCHSLRCSGYQFKLNIIGDGPEREYLERQVAILSLDDTVKFLGEISHDDTLKCMQRSHIFVATSGRMEGWGATVNEAMASGCCVVACESMGSVPFLIQSGVNGISYPEGSQELLVAAVEKLLNCEAYRQKLALRGLDDVNGAWSVENASNLFLDFAKHEIDGLSDCHPSGELTDPMRIGGGPY